MDSKLASRKQCRSSLVAIGLPLLTFCGRLFAKQFTDETHRYNTRSEIQYETSYTIRRGLRETYSKFPRKRLYFTLVKFFELPRSSIAHCTLHYTVHITTVITTTLPRSPSKSLAWGSSGSQCHPRLM